MQKVIEEMSEEHLRIFYEQLIQQRKVEIKNVEEQSKKNKKENIETLEKHFHDRTIQPISEFKKVGEKEEGCSSGFQAEHEYSDNEGDKAPFMIKSVLNHTLTKEEEQSKLAQFKESFYKGSRKATKLQNPYLPNFIINNNLDLLWQQVESSICYDDLNIADFIREYVAGDLYKLFLYDRAPIVELVTNDNLPKKRFVSSNDKFKEHIEQEKYQDKLYLRSKFLDKFTTLVNLQGKGKNYQDAKGFEKILAAQILLGEADIIQPENFGVIEKEYENAKGKKVKEKLWAKIDHGRSFCLSFSNVKDYLQNLSTFLITLRSYVIKIDLEKLSKELEDLIDCYDKNKEKFKALIDRKASTLNHVFNPNMQFNLRYIDGSRSNVRNFKYMDEEFKGKKIKKVSFSIQIPDNNFPSTNLNDYFKQNLENQVQMARNLTGALKDLAEPWKSFDRIEKVYSYIIKPSFCLFVPMLTTAIFTSGTLGTVFTVATAVTGMCMLVGIVIGICLGVYAMNSYNSKINNPKVEEFQKELQLC